MSSANARRPLSRYGVAAWIVSGCVLGCGGGGGTGFGSTPDGGVSFDGRAPTSDAAMRDAGAVDTGLTPGSDGGHPTGPDAAAHDTGAPVDAGHDVTLPGTDSGGSDDTGAPPPHDGGVAQVAIVYGQSADILYSVNPTTKAVTTIGPFIGCASEVIDIALNKTSQMYATTADGVYTVNTTTAVCSLIASGSYPNSLSFVPAGTLDPSAEALVGYNGPDYVRIDTTSGALTTVGSLGSSGYASSGDIVSVIGGGTYLTVTGGADCGSNDCLVEVNPTTGALITNYGSVQHSQVYGLAFWAGNLYGFDNGGDLFEVTFPDAGGLGITTIPIPNPPLGLSFYGAGSTTAAPRK
jgi:hypothetical protein